MCMKTIFQRCASEIRPRFALNAYPDRVFHGRIGNIGPVLDPNIRTAKVRIEVRIPA